jgi:hypothetical protein
MEKAGASNTLSFNSVHRAFMPEKLSSSAASSSSSPSSSSYNENVSVL